MAINLLYSFSLLLYRIKWRHTPWHTVRMWWGYDIQFDWIWSWADIDRNCNTFFLGSWPTNSRWGLHKSRPLNTLASWDPSICPRSIMGLHKYHLFGVLVLWTTCTAAKSFLLLCGNNVGAMNIIVIMQFLDANIPRACTDFMVGCFEWTGPKMWPHSAK